MYIPLGVGVVIPPWNFPLAILAGMTSAAIVAGNTVVLKPSSDSPLIGWKFMEIMEEAGLPAGVLNFVSGPGGAVGDTLVHASEDPLRLLHRVEGSRHSHQRSRGEGAARTDLAEAGGGGDGRKGLHHRG